MGFKETARVWTTMTVFLTVAALFVGCQESTSAQRKETSVHKTTAASDSQESATAILAGGCFWCVESDFEKLPGVLDVVSGYSGGTTENPTYENYSAGGHREVVKVSYDPARVTYAGLFEWLIKHIDPVDSEGSFNDRGRQYSPAVYYENDDEKAAAASVIGAVDAMEVFAKPISLDVVQREEFWPAEEYHQDYHSKSLVKYDYYRYRSGRDAFIEKHWGKRASELELPESVPDIPVKALHSWENFSKPPNEVLRKRLSGIQYQVTQEDGTESAFKNEYWDNSADGIYVDIVSGEPLFSSADKYKSGTGWPSFVKPVDTAAIALRDDPGLFGSRTEVRSRIADSHLGHLFADGPSERGGKRYCMNSAAMRFVPREKMEEEGYSQLLPMVEDKNQ